MRMKKMSKNGGCGNMARMKLTYKCIVVNLTRIRTELEQNYKNKYSSCGFWSNQLAENLRNLPKMIISSAARAS